MESGIIESIDYTLMSRGTNFLRPEFVFRKLAAGGEKI